MLRCAFAIVVLFATHLTAGDSSAQTKRCRTGFVPAKTDQIKSLRSKGIAEVRGTTLFYQATLEATDKNRRTFLMTLASANLDALTRLVNTGALASMPAVCARIDPTNYLARTQRLVSGSSLTARYNGYEIDAGRIFPR